MEHVILAPTGGAVTSVNVSKGDTVFEGHPLFFLEPCQVAAERSGDAEQIDLTSVRPDVKEVHERQSLLLDDARPDAVSLRRKRGQRTARENVYALMDPGSVVEYGGFVVAAQHHRRSLDDLIRNTPADGLITALGTVNGDKFDPVAAKCAVMAYDYTVLAGTQGQMNHKKMDRMLEVAYQGRLPVVLFSEGGGGRPGDFKIPGGHRTFTMFPRMSGRVPLIGVNSRYCFAGNAALLGCCDVIIATRNSNIGMGGPAMIEGGGLGVFRAEEIGPAEVQVKNGVIDILVDDESEAVRAAKKYLSYFQGNLKEWTCVDQRRLRSLVPEDRRRVYDMRAVIQACSDTDSVLELRREFGLSIITVFARIEGRPFGIIANNPKHLGGAIDSDGADKGARFMALCEAFRIPIVSLCDTPGIMVGPEVEKSALVRHASRMLLVGANLTVPFFSIVVRKAYGIGKIAMMGGHARTPFYTVSWPTGEFGSMNLEGVAKLGYRKELAAIKDPSARRERYESIVAELVRKAKALNFATELGIDTVIDPMETRQWIIRGQFASHRTHQGPPKEIRLDAW